MIWRAHISLQAFASRPGRAHFPPSFASHCNRNLRTSPRISSLSRRSQPCFCSSSKHTRFPLPQTDRRRTTLHHPRAALLPRTGASSRAGTSRRTPARSICSSLPLCPPSRPSLVPTSWTSWRPRRRRPIRSWIVASSRMARTLHPCETTTPAFLSLAGHSRLISPSSGPRQRLRPRAAARDQWTSTSTPTGRQPQHIHYPRPNHPSHRAGLVSSYALPLGH